MPKALLALSLLFLSAINYAQIEKSLVLDGCSNYFEVPDDDLLDQDTVLSIECWVMPNCDDENRMIVSKEWCQGAYGYYLSIDEGRLSWSYSSTGFCTGPNLVKTFDNVVSNQFTHVAVVHSQTEIKLFINGNEAAAEQTQGSFASIHNSTEPFRIGAYKNISQTFGNYFSGLIDEIRVWNTELTTALIQERMNGSLNGDEAGLVLYLDMEENGVGSSLTLENQSSVGNSLNAQSMGFTSYSPYTVDHNDYNNSSVDIVQDGNSLSINPGNYKSILWSTGESGESINVSAPGPYAVTVETELCKFFEESIEVEFLDAPIEDCVGADTICTASIIMSNPQGSGIDDFANPNNDAGCNNLDERISEWYYFEIGANAPDNTPLGFVITPVGGQGEDYDFAIFGPDPSCDNLGSPIRCSYASSTCNFCPQTGLGNGATETSEDASGDGFVQELFVNAGDRFYLFVNNFDQSGLGFDLEWTLEGAQYLNCNPAFVCTLEVDAGEDYSVCIRDEGYTLSGSFTGQQLENSSEWTLLGSDETYLSDPTSLNPTVELPSGTSGIFNYVLTVQDTSMNSGCFVSDTVTISVENCFECMLQVDAGQHDTICDIQGYMLSGSFSGEQLENSVQWELLDSSNAYLSDPTILNPMVQLPTGAQGTYTYVLHVQDTSMNIGCTVSDTVTLTIAENSSDLLDISIVAPRLRPCSSRRMFVKYYNTTGSDAYDVNIDFTFDHDEFTISSDVAPNSTAAGSMHWEIDTLRSGERGVYTLTIATSCNTPLGNTYCFEARIDGENPCGQQLTSASAELSQWDGITFDLSSKCDGNQVYFRVANIGDVDMVEEYPFTILENDHVAKIHFSKLAAGEESIVELPANGSTYRMEAPRDVNHPTYSEYVEVIEACDVDNEYSKGFVNMFAQDNLEAQVDIACVTITNSFDPNEKEVYPLGTTTHGFIDNDQWLQYRIDFQNTGTDVAYDVWIEDPLSTLFDLSTLEIIHGSHPFRMSVQEPNWSNGEIMYKLQVYFRSINLPDIRSDEEGSKGFFIYRIKPKSDLKPGIKIENTADIFFDNNEPVRTSTTLNTIKFPTNGTSSKGEVGSLPVGKSSLPETILISPNPGKEYIQIHGLSSDSSVNISIFSAQGQLILNQKLNTTESIDIEHLSPGFYLIEINDGPNRYVEKFEKM